MTTAKTTLDIKYIIKSTDTRTFATDTVQLELTNSSTTKLIQLPTIVAQTATTDGSITFSAVPLELGDSTISIKFANNIDLDTNGTIIETLGNGYINRIDDTATEFIL